MFRRNQPDRQYAPPVPAQAYAADTLFSGYQARLHPFRILVIKPPPPGEKSGLAQLFADFRVEQQTEDQQREQQNQVCCSTVFLLPQPVATVVHVEQ
jgi:hypothetical protein